jgi:hypothetical protein
MDYEIEGEVFLIVNNQVRYWGLANNQVRYWGLMLERVRY